MRPSTWFLLLVFAVCLLAGTRSSRQNAPRTRLSSKVSPAAAAIRYPRVIDSAYLLPPGEAARLEDWLRRLREESGVDVRLLFLAHKPTIPLSEYGVRAMRTLGVGEKDDRRGVLLLADRESQQFRIEVGPGLEGVLPDGFTSFILNEHIAPLFRTGDPNLGVRLALFMIQRRIRDAILGEEYDPRPITYIREPHRLAGGAGAVASTPLDNQYQALTTSHTTDSAAAAYFVPQPTPEAVRQRYLELLALPRFYPYVTLLTPESQEYMGRLPMSNGFKTYLLYGFFGRKVGVDVRGDLAMIYYTDTPFISPHYLRRGPDGWQLDIIAELRNSLEYTGGAYTWTLRDSGDDFSQRFADRTIKIRSIYRVRGGDNRRLRTGYWARHQSAAQ